MRRIMQSAVLMAALFANAHANAQPGALEDGAMGLFEAAEFRAVDGRCTDCTAPKLALWYFEGDLVAIPKHAKAPSSSFSDQAVADDVRQWAHGYESPPHTLPFMSWLGSPELIQAVTLNADGTSLSLPGASTMPFAVVPKLSTNRSYFNADTVAFFSKR